MTPVDAPAGFEGQMYYDDYTRSYKVACRETGDAWWTLCGDAGHAYLPVDERATRAEDAIVRYLTAHGKIR